MKQFDPLPCGHPALLLVQSTESDYTFCELCEARSERTDALQMEDHLGARVRILTSALEAMVKAFGLYVGHECEAAQDEIDAVRNARAALRNVSPEAASE